MFRLRSNCSTMFERPSELVELIEFNPAIDANCLVAQDGDADGEGQRQRGKRVKRIERHFKE